MSNTGFSSISGLCTQSSVDPVLAALNADMGNDVEVATIKSVFQQMSAHAYSSSEERLQNDKNAVQATIGKVGYRHQLLKKYAPSFFPKNHSIDMDALTVATIRNELLYDLDPEIEDGEGNIYLRDGGMDSGLFKRANVIFESARDLSDFKKHALLQPPKEAQFLAHINFLEELKEIDNLFEDHDKSDLQEKLRTNIFPMLDFIKIDTPIGELVDKEIDGIAWDIVSLFPSAGHLKPLSVSPSVIHRTIRFV